MGKIFDRLIGLNIEGQVSSNKLAFYAERKQLALNNP